MYSKLRPEFLGVNLLILSFSFSILFLENVLSKYQTGKVVIVLDNARVNTAILRGK